MATAPIIAGYDSTDRRITEDGNRRITEDALHVRITEYNPQVPVPYDPPAERLSDIKTSWDAGQLHGDWSFAPPDVVTGRDLETAAIISLFTDRLAEPDDRLPDPDDADRRGWWADWEQDHLIGSRLWLLAREKQTEDVRRRAEDYCREALQWMLDDDVADAVDVVAEWNASAPGRLDVSLTIARKRSLLLQRSYSWAWGQLFPRLLGG
jgi:phage gp46-like protein